MVHPDEVQRAVDDGLAQVGGHLGADDDVAELPRAGGVAVEVDRERQDVGRRVLGPPLGVELADALRTDELDGDVAVVDLRRRERERGQPLDLDGAKRMIRVIEALEDSDDVQDVFANGDIPDDVLAQLDEE